TLEHGGVRSEVRVPLVPGLGWPGVPWWAPLPVTLALLGIGPLLPVRAAHWHLTRRLYVATLLGAFVAMPYFGSPTAPRIGLIRDLFVSPFAYGFLAWILFEFVPGLQLWGPWQRAA